MSVDGNLRESRLSSIIYIKWNFVFHFSGGEDLTKEIRDKTRISKTSEYKHKRKKVTISIIAGSVVLGTIIIFVSMLSFVNGWEDRIYPNVSIEDVDVGALTKQEATKLINEKKAHFINDKKLNILIGNKNKELVYRDISPSYDIEKTVEEAFKVGKENGIFGKYFRIKSENKKQLELYFNYDEKKLNEYVKELVMENNIEPKNAKIKLVNGDFVIDPEVEGLSVKLDDVDLVLKKSINGTIMQDERVVIDAEIIEPKIKAKDFEQITGKLSSYSTSYGSSSAGRCNNIELATKLINGTIIMPGEVFSFNDIVGDRTAKRGFKEAGVYVGNKVESDIGGGICQVSTSLYRAAMRANLKSLERRNHSMAVGYALPGLDATVAYGYIDYKFKNTYDFPIYIEGVIAGKTATYNIYGNQQCLNGYTYDMVNEIVETLNPEKKIIEDYKLDYGTEVVESNGIVGYKSISYKVTYRDGAEINRDIVSKDIYSKVDNVIKKGIKQKDSKSDKTEIKTENNQKLAQ